MIREGLEKCSDDELTLLASGSKKFLDDPGLIMAGAAWLRRKCEGYNIPRSNFAAASQYLSVMCPQIIEKRKV